MANKEVKTLTVDDVTYDIKDAQARADIANKQDKLPDGTTGYFLKKTDTGVEWASAGSGSGSNIGDIFYTTRMDTALAGAVECNGGTYSTADYEGAGSIGELLAGGKLPYISLEDYAQQISETGYCGAFGWDGGTTTAFRVPLLKDIFIEAAPISEGQHTYRMRAGLPDHNHIYTEAFQSGGNSGGSWPGTAAYRTSYTRSASESNPIYGRSNTVQPEAVKYRAMVQLFNATTDQAVATVGTVVADVSGLKDMSNITSTGKDAVVGWGIPDYSAGIVVASDIADFTERTYTAPADGVIAVYLVAFNGQDAYIKIDDVTVERVVGYGNGAWTMITGLYPVKKGSVIKFKDGYPWVSLIGSKGVTFFPFTK